MIKPHNLLAFWRVNQNTGNTVLTHYSPGTGFSLYKETLRDGHIIRIRRCWDASLGCFVAQANIYRSSPYFYCLIDPVASQIAEMFTIVAAEIKHFQGRRFDWVPPQPEILAIIDHTPPLKTLVSINQLNEGDIVREHNNTTAPWLIVNRVMRGYLIPPEENYSINNQWVKILSTWTELEQYCFTTGKNIRRDTTGFTWVAEMLRPSTADTLGAPPLETALWSNIAFDVLYTGRD